MDPKYWHESLMTALLEMWKKVATFIPNVLGAVSVLLVGFLISLFLRYASSFLLRKLGLDKLGEKTNIHSGLRRLSLSSNLSDLFGQAIFWIFILLFFSTAVETLGLETFSKALSSLVAYLPKVLAAGAIVVFGMWLAGSLRDLIFRTSDRMGSQYAKVLSNTVYSVFIVFIVVLAIGQLDFETELLNKTIEIILITVGGALLLMFGLGAKNIAENVISGIYLKESYNPGDKVSFDEESGELEVIGTIATRIKLEAGNTMEVPNSQFAND
jgi:small-conductance mechanosensitive channel